MCQSTRVSEAWWTHPIWSHPSTRTPALGVIKFTILGHSSLVIITILSFCLIYASVKRKRNKAISLYELYGHTLAKNSCPKGHLVDLSLVIITTGMYLLCLWEEKKMFNEIMHFHYNDLYSHAPAQEPLSQVSWNLQFW